MTRDRPKLLLLATAPSSSKSSTQQLRRHRPQWREAVAGASAGACAKTAMAPIERVKLIKQLEGSLLQYNQDPHKQKYSNSSSAWSLARTVYKEQGLLAFWRGNLANVVQQAGMTGLNFMLMDWYKQAAVSPFLMGTMDWWPPASLTRRSTLQRRESLRQRQRRRELLSSFLSGGLAGGTATTVLYPIQFLRTRLALDVGATPETRLYRRGMRDALFQTYTTDGVRGLYQGYGIAVLGVIVYRALHLGGYDALKSELLLHRRNRDTTTTTTTTNERDELLSLTWTERIAAAQVVSLTAGTLCYPIDSVRRRLMMQAGVPVSQRLYKHTMDCFRTVWRQEGLRGFYLGIGPNLVRSIGAALLLVGYDVFKVML